MAIFTSKDRHDWSTKRELSLNFKFGGVFIGTPGTVTHSQITQHTNDSTTTLWCAELCKTNLWREYVKILCSFWNISMICKQLHVLFAQSSLQPAGQVSSSYRGGFTSTLDFRCFTFLGGDTFYRNYLLSLFSFILAHHIMFTILPYMSLSFCSILKMILHVIWSNSDNFLFFPFRFNER